jgi:hypothetical protein
MQILFCSFTINTQILSKNLLQKHTAPVVKKINSSDLKLCHFPAAELANITKKKLRECFQEYSSTRTEGYKIIQNKTINNQVS